MRIQKVNQNNYRTQQKPSFKENVLTEITHFPNTEFLLTSKLDTIISDTVLGLYDKIILLGHIAQDNVGSIIHNRSKLPQKLELCWVDESTPMAQIARKLEGEQITPRVFYDAFTGDPKLKRISIRAIYDRSEFEGIGKIATPTPAKRPKSEGIILTTTPTIKF